MSAETTTKPKPSPVPVARNDPTLAHAMAAHELEKFRLGSGHVYSTLDRFMDRSEVSKRLRTHFGDLLLHETVTRARWSGKAARADWLMLDPLGDGSAFTDDRVAVLLRKSRRGLWTEQLPAQLSPHAVSRFFQRTQGHGELRGLARLYDHLLAALLLLSEGRVELGQSVETATSIGALGWRSIPGDGAPVAVPPDNSSRARSQSGRRSDYAANRS